MEIWILHPDATLRVRIAHFAETRGQVAVGLDGWEAAVARLKEQPAARPLLVIDPYSGSDGDTLDPRILTIRAEFPSVSIVPAMVVDARTADHVVTLGRWGVASVITLSLDLSPARLERRLTEATEREALHDVISAIPDRLAPRARALVEAALLTAQAGGSASHLSGRLFASLRTVERRAARAGLPAPRQLVAWMRLLLAARLLDDPGRTVAGAALAAGYAHDVSLHRALSRARLPRAREAREQRGGALAAAARAFDALRRPPVHP